VTQAAGGPPPPSLPDWARRIHAVLPSITARDLTRWTPPAGAVTRPAAVLMLFGDDAPGGDLLLLERASTLRSHPAPAAFPGGALDPDDATPVDAALREAEEETGLDPAGVHVLGTLPELFLPPSGFSVTPVVGWWRRPVPVAPASPAEVAHVERVALHDLLDPANRWTVRHPSGFVGPAFTVGPLFVWGFTAGLLSRLLAIAGLERPWDTAREHPLPDRVAGTHRRQPAARVAGVGDQEPEDDVAEDYEAGEVEP
jgi:8-oxo-dGTP pyrophosphatase MutT (NUDIX family)